MESLQNFRQNRTSVLRISCLVALGFICKKIYIFFLRFSKLEGTLGFNDLCKNGKLKEVAYHTKCYLVFLQLKELSLSFGCVFEHMHLGTLTINGVSKQLSLFIDRIKQTPFSNHVKQKSRYIASFGWFVVLRRFSVEVD